MKLFAILALCAAICTTPAHSSPPPPYAEQPCTVEAPQYQVDAQQCISIESATPVAVGEAQVFQEHPPVLHAGFDLFTADCCGGGGWGSTALRSPYLYISLAFLGLLYAGRRLLWRTQRRARPAL